MLADLKIENFRLFKNLHIEGLKRVNLFTGKNNCGKTALLEALRIMAAGEDLSVMLHILENRGQNINVFEEYDSFFNRKVFESRTSKGSINLSINDFVITRTQKGESNISYQLKTAKSLHPDLRQLSYALNLHNLKIPRDRVIYVPFGLTDYFPLENLWSSIVLTPDEDTVIEILKKTILPDLIRLDVKPGRTLVRLEGEKKPIPLKNLGDGAERVLLLAIALVGAKDKLLLIDEIEAGLHYSVIEKLWEIIFKYSKELEVQVFATTHSSDVVKSFTYLLERAENKEDGAFFRMQRARTSGEIEVIPYDAERLEFALESNLETR